MTLPKEIFQPHLTTYSRIDEIVESGEFVKKGKRLYLNLPIAFDIETTSFYDNKQKTAIMYAWVLGINGKTILGRTWEEFFECIDYLIKFYEIGDKRNLIIYVHNLSFEFQFLRKHFEWETVFAIEERKPIYARTKSGIEFRCSYILSNLSLDNVAKNLTTYKVSKLVGDLDYELLRHSKTFLSDKEKQYIINDCLVVMCYIQELIESEGSIAKIPLTQTSFIRNQCRENCLKGEQKFFYSGLMKSLTMTSDDYRQFKRAFSGGFTHANYTKADKTLNNLYSFDLCSSYPTVMIAEKFPMTKPKRRTLNSEEEFIKYLDLYACIFEVTFYEIEATQDFEHYISISRCYEAEHYYLNNGRVIGASKISLTVTELDFKIICKLYTWEKVEIGNFKTMYKDYLPKPLRMTILELYKSKTELKDIEEQFANYMKSKGRINSVYGMCCTDTCRTQYIYNNGWETELPNIDEEIDKINNDRSRFLFFAWGVWVTAYARTNLFSAILELKNDYVYSDTDSVKFEHYERHKKYFDKYNKDIQLKLKKSLNKMGVDNSYIRPKTKNGIEKPLGVWENDGIYKKFKTLGAKRYLYIDEKDEPHITVAGVSKKIGVEYLKDKYKTNDEILKNFTDELIFPSEYYVDNIKKSGSGKLTHTYIDDERKGKLIDYNGVECDYEELSCIHLEPTEYSLSMDTVYLNLINGVKQNEILYPK